MWDPAIRKFARTWPHFIHVLLLMIVHRITESKVITENRQKRGYHNSLMICWFGHIIDNFALKPRAVMEWKKYNVPLLSILHMCANKIDKWTIKIIKKLKPFISDVKYLRKIRIALSFYNQGQDIRRTERKLPSKRRREENDDSSSLSVSLSDIQNEDMVVGSRG